MSANKIHVLSPVLCNQIAAGEVLERASSAVKELVENSLDAGATSIEIEIEDGGKKRLCVTDDGCGMTAEDARLSVVRHATSKITTVDDLAKIGTMGFRGEALASMASVSRLTILTKRPEDEAGTCLKIEGAVEQSCTEAAAPTGTQITLEDLFFNTPARLKFLKTNATEQRRVYEVIEQFALACPEVHFKLIVDGRVKCDYPKNRNLRERAHAVLGRALYDHLYDITPYKLSSVSVDGVFCSPDYIQSVSGRLFTYVNQRIVKDKTIISAINQAYREFLHGKQPCAIIFVNMPFDLVDVNVHPTKHEVRFQDQDLVFRAVHRALRNSLESAPWIKSVQQPTPSSFVTQACTTPDDDFTPVEPSIPQSSEIFDACRLPSTIGQTGSPFSKCPISAFESLPASAFDSPERQQRSRFGVPDPTIPKYIKPLDACAQDGLSFCDDDDDLVDTLNQTNNLAHATYPINNAANPTPIAIPTNNASSSSDMSQPTNEATQSASVAPSSTESTPPWQPTLKLTRPDSWQSQVSSALGEEPMLPLEMPQNKGYFSSLRYIGQIALTYLLCEDNNNLVIVDQHAAHERINFEKLKRVADKEQKPVSQVIMFPQRLQLDTRLADVLREFTPFFEDLGFQIDPISDNSFAIRSVPDILVDYDYVPMLRDALTDLAEQGRATQFEQFRDDVLATMACHQSIRAGFKMTPEDAYRLFREMDATSFRSNCPHGRPVHFILTRAEIEKRFLRTGFNKETSLF